MRAMKQVALLVALFAMHGLVFAESAGGRFESMLGFALNAATLEDVTNRLGPAERFDVPEGHHEFAVCYGFPDSKAVVLFSSDREFGGAEEELLGVSVLEDNALGFPCAPLESASQQVGSDGLRLGMSERDFREVVGDPVERADNGDFFRIFDSERPLTRDELKKISVGFPGVYDRPVIDVTHSIWGRFDDHRLVGFGYWKVETL